MSDAHVVASRAAKAREALAARDAAIVAMAARGASLRVIATAAGLSNSGVRKIVQRDAS